jgi:hypothetical protein
MADKTMWLQLAASIFFEKLNPKFCPLMNICQRCSLHYMLSLLFKDISAYLHWEFQVKAKVKITNSRRGLLKRLDSIQTAWPNLY